MQDTLLGQFKIFLGLPFPERKLFGRVLTQHDVVLVSADRGSG